MQPRKQAYYQINENYLRMVFVWMILVAFLVTGCPKKQTIPSPAEEKKEASELTPPQQAPQEPERAQPTPPRIPPSPRPTPPAPPPPASAPKYQALANGETLLDPAVKENAELIQTRLADLGLYKSPIDGIWGKGSQAALRMFKKQNSLVNPERWDRETQMLLFREMPSDPEAMKRALSKAEILLDPAIPQDAKLIQTRLADAGFYKGGTDGIWGKGSKAALKAFKEKNSLENSDQWDKETQINLFR